MGAQVIVTKLMSPIVQLRFSKQICVIARDGNLYLSFRLGHPQGHCITNLTVEATWTHSETTAEGEKFVQIDLVEFPMQGSVLFLPRTFTHKIDPTSPFWPYREALCEAHGQLIVHVCGNDRYLHTEFCDAWVYNMPDVRGVDGAHQAWAEIFRTVGDGAIVADLARIDEVVHAIAPSPSPSAACNNLG